MKKNNEYYQYWNYSKKKGYSGTATFCKKQPVNVTYGINNEKLDYEGRTITLEFEDVYIVNTYTPCIQKNIQNSPNPNLKKWHKNILNIFKQ